MKDQHRQIQKVRKVAVRKIKMGDDINNGSETEEGQSIIGNNRHLTREREKRQRKSDISFENKTKHIPMSSQASSMAISSN